MNIVYENSAIQHCKKQCHSIEKKFDFLPYQPPNGSYKILAGISQKLFFFQFSYLIRVEHDKCSEMCVWIVRLRLKLRKLDQF
jgi:hypothetical protein